MTNAATNYVPASGNFTDATKSHNTKLITASQYRDRYNHSNLGNTNRNSLNFVPDINNSILNNNDTKDMAATNKTINNLNNFGKNKLSTNHKSNISYGTMYNALGQ